MVGLLILILILLLLLLDKATHAHDCGLLRRFTVELIAVSERVLEKVEWWLMLIRGGPSCEDRRGRGRIELVMNAIGLKGTPVIACGTFAPIRIVRCRTLRGLFLLCIMVQL